MALDLTEAFFDAINGIAQRNIQAAAMDLTIDCEVQKAYNIDIGEYKVLHEGSIFSAFSSDPTVTYKNGDKVYVLVPQGDMSRKKVILGHSAYQNGLTYGDLQQMTNFYIEKGPNWLSDGLYRRDHKPLEICVTKQEKKSDLKGNANYWDYGFCRSITQKVDKVRYPNPMPGMEEAALKQADFDLQQLSRKYGYVKVEATFRTEFSGVHNCGEYGLVVEVLVENPAFLPKDHPQYNPSEPQYKTIFFKLGFDQFSGAPYASVVDTPQRAYFPVTIGAIRGLQSVSLWQDGTFVTDMIPTYKPDGTLVWETEVTDRNNVFVEDIDIRFCEKVNLTDTLYYPWIETPLGDAVYDKIPGETVGGRRTVTLIPHFQYGANDIVNDESVEVMWFIEKANITEADVNTDEVDKHGLTWFDKGGRGWYPIYKMIAEGECREGIPYDIDKDTQTLLVPLDQVPFRWNYKAVFIYRDMSKEEQPIITQVEVVQSITRLDSKYALELVQETADGGRTVQLHIIDHNNDSRYVNEGKVFPREWYGQWWLKRQDGSYVMVSDAIQEGPFAINQWLNNDVVTFYVQCFDPYEIDPNHTMSLKQVQEVAVLTKVIMTAEEGDFKLTWVGKDTFNYDALGTIKPWSSTGENSLVPQIDFLDGRGIDYSITVQAPDGRSLNTKDYYDQIATGDNFPTGSGYNIPSSMMTNMWVDAFNTIHFKVREQYDIDKTDNTFTIEITTYTGEKYIAQKEIFFTKDGDQGTIGSDWVAPIYPCNSGNAHSIYGDVVESRFLERVERPSPLILVRDGTGWKQNENYRVYLRPFVQKNGKTVESGVGSDALDPFEAYFYKCYWDVRMPSSVGIDRCKYASFLRLYHAEPDGRAGTVFTRKADDMGGQSLGGIPQGAPETIDVPAEYSFGSKVNPKEKDLNNPDRTSANGLVAYSCYPRVQYLEDDKTAGQKENYGAVEIRFFNNERDGTGATLEEMLYRFIVKCQVEIYKGQYDQSTHRISVEGNPERVATIVSYYPIDVLFDEEGRSQGSQEQIREFNEKLQAMTTNWPQWVQYNATGYDPVNLTKPMEFNYGGQNCAAYNLSPLTQTLEESKREEVDGRGNGIGKYYLYQMYRAKPHLNFQEGFHGVLRTYCDSDSRRSDVTIPSPFGRGFYLRNQVMYLNAYGNVDINGWDGQGIDMNEEEGTIFAITIGAGYKNPNTNAFTGVLMGRDRSQKKEDYLALMKGLNKNDPNWTFTQQDLEEHPYMAGLFGYQDGVSSFAILENGTAFFGRADRGGRIIIDGSNATIYGGGNGLLGSPEIGDPMWNCMRLTLVDLTHSVSPETGRVNGYWSNVDEDKCTVNTIPIKGANGAQVTQGFNGAYFTDFNIPYMDNMLAPDGHALYSKLDWTVISSDLDTLGDNIFQAKYGDKDGYAPISLPTWYKMLWRYAYIKPDGALPYWYDSDGNAEERYDGLTYFNSDQHDPFRSGSKNAENWAINYWDGPSFKDMHRSTDEDEWNDAAIQLSGFGASRASTTPAIEIGQHQHGLMPGLLPWDSYETIFRTIGIPGDRNFMVTYDGTLWAMNGIFMGAIIGSNIIGGRIQGAELGIGHDSFDDKDIIYEINNVDDWEKLIAPKEVQSDIGTAMGTPGNVASYIDEKGNLKCNSLQIYGGTIDIGHFHIIGKEWLMKRVIDESFEESTDKGRWMQNKINLNSKITINAGDGETMEVYPRDEIGHLIQYAHSDFIGPTHFYANVGIGPKRKPVYTTGDSTTSFTTDLGSLIQTYGFVAFGIPLKVNEEISASDDRSAEYHGNIWGEIIKKTTEVFLPPDEVEEGKEVTPLSIQKSLSKVYSNSFWDYVDTAVKEEQKENPVDISRLTDSQYKVAADFFGDDKFPTLEASAFFGIDASSQDFPAYTADLEPDTERDMYSYRQGHMWPMFYRFGKPAKIQAISENKGKKKYQLIHAYMTTMNAFASSAIKFDNGTSTYEQDIGQNYFRAGPFGVESTVTWVRKNFQNQWSSEMPVPNDYRLPSGGNYIGWMGMVNRAGTGKKDATLQMALGMTSWYGAPMIFESDAEWKIQAAGRSLHYSTGYGQNIAFEDGNKWHTWKYCAPDDVRIEDNTTGFGILMDQGEMRMSRHAPKDGEIIEEEFSGKLNTVRWATSKGSIGIGIQGEMTKDETSEKWKAYLKNSWNLPIAFGNSTGALKAGINIDTYCHQTDSGGLRIWNGAARDEAKSMDGVEVRNGDIHIIRHTAKVLSHSCESPEYFTQKYLREISTGEYIWTDDVDANKDLLRKAADADRSLTEMWMGESHIRVNAGWNGFLFTMGHGVHSPSGWDPIANSNVPGAAFLFGMDFFSTRWRHNRTMEAIVDMNAEGCNGSKTPKEARGFFTSRDVGVFVGKTKPNGSSTTYTARGQGLWIDEKRLDECDDTTVMLGHMENRTKGHGFWTNNKVVMVGMFEDEWQGPGGFAMDEEHIDVAMKLKGRDVATWGIDIHDGKVVIGNIHDGDKSYTRYDSDIKTETPGDYDIKVKGLWHLLSKGCVIEKNGGGEFEVKGYEPDEQYGIYARFG